jgi:hypothetical protein
MFDGLVLEGCVTRNKLGRSGRTAKWHAVTEGGHDLSSGQHTLKRLPHLKRPIYETCRVVGTPAFHHSFNSQKTHLSRIDYAAAGEP